MRNAEKVVLNVALGALLALCLLAQITVAFLLGPIVREQAPGASFFVLPGTLWFIVLLLCAEVTLVSIWRVSSLVSGPRVFSATVFRLLGLMIASAIVGTAVIAAGWTALALADFISPFTGFLLAGAFTTGVAFTLVLVLITRLLHSAAANSLESRV